MAGCYGNTAEDRYFEAQLDRYLDSTYPDEFTTPEQVEEAEADFLDDYTDKGD